ncbi:MAG: carboxypeptidase regulatory-like domain-containing protein [Armatimonadetes bacterium]|nr:carboxypeptidase regulatory-like domain-containing protein [Armatimonadota bacterium]
MSVLSLCSILLLGVPSYGPVSITPANVKVYHARPFDVACVGNRVVVAYEGNPQPLNKTAHYVATSTTGRWQLHTVGAMPTRSTRGQCYNYFLLTGEQGKVYFLYHDWAGNDTVKIVEVRGNNIIPVVSVPRREINPSAFPKPRAMTYDGHYLWVAGECAIARIYRTQVQTLQLKGLYCGSRILDLVAPNGKPVRLGDYLKVSRLKPSASAWQQLSSWELLSRDKLPREVSSLAGFPSTLLKGDGSRLWRVRVPGNGTNNFKHKILVLTGRVGPNSVGQWKVLYRSLPADVRYVRAIKLVRTPSGQPKIVAVLETKHQNKITYDFVAYDVTATSISQPHSIGSFEKTSNGPTVGSYMAAAVDASGYFYVAFQSHYKLYVMSNNPRWKGTQIAQGQSGGTGGGGTGTDQGATGGTGGAQGGPQQATGGGNVGAGLPDLVPAPAEYTHYDDPTRCRLSTRGGDVSFHVDVLNKGATLKQPVTVLYEFAGIKLYSTVTPSEDGGTVYAGKRTHVYPELRVYLHCRPQGAPLRRSYAYRDPQTGKHVTTSTPPTIRARPVVRGHSYSRLTVEATLPLGKYKLRVTVDPEHKIHELREGNNVYEATFVVAGGQGFYDANHNYISMPNDVAVCDAVRIWPQDETHQPGFVRGKATAQVWILNPRLGDWFDKVTVRASLDGHKVWEGTVGPLPRDKTVPPRQIFSTATNRSDKLSAVLVAIPLDFSHVSLGRHTLKIEADPDDLLGDRYRANNTWSQRILVRKRGGTLIVTTKDRGTGRAISGALVIIWKRRPGGGRELLCDGLTNAQGQVTFKDLPPGGYPKGGAKAVKHGQGSAAYALTDSGPFTMRSGQTTRVTILLERPVELSGKLLDAATGQPVKYGEVWMDDDLHCWARNGNDKFKLVKPGPHVLKVAAFGYATIQRTLQVHADAQAKMTKDFRLQSLPRGTLTVKCQDDKHKAIKYAYVDLRGTPLGGSTDSQGKVTFTGVPAGRTYKVAATRDGYGPASGTSPTISAGATATLTLTLPKVEMHHARVQCKAITWADLESFPGLSLGSASSPSWKVKAEFGVFKTDLVLHYHKLRGGASGEYVYLDDLYISFFSGPFYNATVSSTYDPSDLISGAVGKLYKPAGEALEKVGTLLTVASIPNDLYDLVTGEQADLSGIHEGTLYGSHTTHTGAEEESASFYYVPDPSIELGMTASGGKTIVLLRKIDITDGTTSLHYQPWWYSPGLMHLSLWGKKMKWDEVTVTLNIDVLNQNRGYGVLGTRGRNNMTWHPSKNKDLHMEPVLY